jgi:hypothetical protein
MGRGKILLLGLLNPTQKKKKVLKITLMKFPNFEERNFSRVILKSDIIVCIHFRKGKKRTSTKWTD